MDYPQRPNSHQLEELSVRFLNLNYPAIGFLKDHKMIME